MVVKDIKYIYGCKRYKVHLPVMACFHYPTPIPIAFPIQMANIIMYRTVSTEPIPISILMQLGTVPNLTLISVPIRWFVSNFHRNFASE